MTGTSDDIFISATNGHLLWKMGGLESFTTPETGAAAHQTGRRAIVVTAVTVAAVLWVSLAHIGVHWVVDRDQGKQVVTTGDNELWTDWDLIDPSEDLRWVPCFRVVDDFLCARLTVPLDYNRPLNQSTSFGRPSPKVHIALIMLPGMNHTESGAWSESPLLVNPGGPGGSGTSLVMAAGREHQKIAGPGLDIVGFDPRGVGATTPQADCFSDMSVDVEAQSVYEKKASKEGSLMCRVLWLSENQAVGLPNTSSTATEQIVFRQSGLTKLCNTQDHPDSILRYAGTPNVAQDLMTIVQAWERWTASLMPQPAEAKVGDDVHGEAPPESTTRSIDSQPPSTRGKLVYWGFSYGTILGATFATMFPEHVGRMVLDGVVNSDEWYYENVSSVYPFLAMLSSNTPYR